MPHREPPRTPAELRAAFASIRPWRRGHERAPHKPLLLLYALARVQRGESARMGFEEVEGPLTALLREFGPSRSAYHPEHPFWHLQSEGVWSVETDDGFVLREGTDSPTRGQLRASSAVAGFPAPIEALLQAEPALVRDSMAQLLAAHFPASMHEDIASAIGLDPSPIAAIDSADEVLRRAGRPRDAAFREKVLRAYERACAMCGMAIRFDNLTVALDAAHIQWHQHDGPSEVWNGLALCVLHHRLFDRGVFTVDEGRRVVVSELVERSEGAEDALLRFHGDAMRRPVHVEDEPRDAVLAWHRREVFRGRGR